MKLANDAKRVRKDIKAAQSLILQKDLKARRKVLKRLGYIDADEMVTTKVCNGFKRALTLTILKCVCILTMSYYSAGTSGSRVICGPRVGAGGDHL